ncbi:MAG: putative secreted protein [Chlamydiia bacterium]|nr:putative secreted protein [Chlamydiia bacterium]
MKAILFSVLIIILSFGLYKVGKQVDFFKSIPSTKDLPAPYNSIPTVLPFDPHGWYYNGYPMKQLFNKNPQIKTVIEIGSWLGASTRHIAQLLPENGKVYAVDHWNGSLEHQSGNFAWHESLPCLYEQFLSNVIRAKLTHKIIPVRMSSLEASKVLQVTPDMIYIDAGHDTESVLKDLETWFPFVKGHGILCGDDYHWPTVAAAVDQFAIAHHLRVEVASNNIFWRLQEN